MAEEKFLGKDLLKELCNGHLPNLGDRWPCCPRQVFDFKHKYTKEEWYKQVKEFSYRLVKADYCSLFYVANAWTYPEAAKYGILFLKGKHAELVKMVDDDKPIGTIVDHCMYLMGYIIDVKKAIRKGSVESYYKVEYMEEYNSIKNTFAKILEKGGSINKYIEQLEKLTLKTTKKLINNVK